MQFTLLGPLQVVRDGSPVDVGGAKQRMVLLSLLLADGSVVSTDRLIEQVWGATPPNKPNVTLRSYISHLRRALEPQRDAGHRPQMLLTRSPGYLLDVADDDVDARAFQAHAADARRSLDHGDAESAIRSASAGLSLWRTDDLSEDLEGFLIAAAHLHEVRSELIVLQQRSLLDLGRHDEAVPTLTARVAERPADEELRRLLMLALYRAGRANEAIATAQDLRRHLGDELGLDPSPATNDLEAKVLANDPALSLDPTVDASPILPDADASPIAIPPGRDHQFATMTDHLESGATVVVTGEPGIGKTTMLTAAADVAESDGRWVAWGRCHKGGESLTLRPWASLVRDLIDRLDDDALREAVGRRGRDLTGFVPEIGDRLDLEARSASDSFAIADAVVRLVRDVAKQNPCTLLFEDLHWADPASAQLLEIAVSSWTDDPITVFASWRDTEPALDEVTPALATIGRAAGARRIELTGLDETTIAAIVEDELGVTDDDALVGSIADRTGGNPLFISELLRQPDPRSAAASTTVREAILQRVDRLPDGALDLLTTAAMCREGFNERSLQLDTADTRSLPAEATLEVLDAAMATRLIEEDPETPSRFRFTHELIAQTLVDSLTPLRQAQRHAQLGRRLEALGAPDAELAHHFLLGSRAGTAVIGAEYACRAARTNRFLHDHLSAISLIEAGLEALDGASDDERMLAEVRIDLLIDLAQGRKHQQRQTDVHALASEAFELAKHIGDTSRMAAAALAFTGHAPAGNRVGSTQWLGYWNPPGPALEMLSASLSKMDDDHPLRPLVLMAHASEMFGPEQDPERARRFIEDGIDAARHIGDPEHLAIGLQKKVTALNRELTIDERETTLDEALAVAEANDFVAIRFAAYRRLAIAALDRGDRSAATEHFRAAENTAAVSGDRHLEMEVESIRISQLIFAGRYVKAGELLRTAFARHESLSPGALTRFGIQFGHMMEDQGRFDRIIDGYRDLYDQYPGPGYGAPFALMLARSGDLDAAQTVLDGLSDGDVLSGGEAELQYTTMSALAELMWWLGDHRRAHALFEAFSAGAGRIVTLFDGITLQASTSVRLGMLASVLGEHEQAETLLDQSLEHHRALEARPGEIQSLAAIADAAGRRGDHGRAGEALAAARELAAELRAFEFLVDEVERRLT